MLVTITFTTGYERYDILFSMRIKLYNMLVTITFTTGYERYDILFSMSN